MKHLFSVLFSEHILKKLERITLVASIAGFLIHLTLVGLFNMGLLGALDASLFSNPISAIYTPFSFIFDLRDLCADLLFASLVHHLAAQTV